MNITYSQNGDYQIPDIAIRKTKPIGIMADFAKPTWKPTVLSFSTNWCYPTISMSIVPKSTKRHETAWS